jgi:hypothetical protein
MDGVAFLATTMMLATFADAEPLKETMRAFSHDGWLERHRSFEAFL